MELKPIFYRLGTSAVLAVSPALANAAGEASGLAENYLVLGVVAALLVFAFTRRGAVPSAAPVPDPQPIAEAGDPPSEGDVVTAEAASDEIAEAAEPAATESEQPVDPSPEEAER